MAVADTWGSWAQSRVALWRTGPKEGMRYTSLPFITTGRCQVSLGQVSDSETKVLHHRFKLVVHSPTWPLGSVHTSVEDWPIGGGEVHKLAFLLNINNNTSLAAPGALAHCLQCLTAC